MVSMTECSLRDDPLTGGNVVVYLVLNKSIRQRVIEILNLNRKDTPTQQMISAKQTNRTNNAPDTTGAGRTNKTTGGKWASARA